MLEPRYVDSQEAPERRSALERAGFQVKVLAAGDVQFPEYGDGTVLVECKRLYQFLADMQTGQLVKQIRALVAESDFPWLALEGPFLADGCKFMDFPSFTLEQFWRQLATLQDMGCRWLRAIGPEETVLRVLDLADYYAKPAHVSASRNLSGDGRVDVLSRIAGVGEARAHALLAALGNLRGVAEASVEALETVEGIGPKTARAIMEFFGDDHAG